MSISVRNIERDFSPSEAAEVSGVSVALQRDWRRRKILAENRDGKWTKFRLTDVIDLSIKKLCTDAGMQVSQVSTLAHMGILPTLNFLSQLPDAVVIEGDEVDDEMKERIVRITVGARGRYLVSTKSDSNEPYIFRSETLEFFEEPRRYNAPDFFIIDCLKLAERIAARTTGPLFRVEVEVEADSEEAAE